MPRTATAELPGDTRDTRDKIVTAALEVFTERGFEAASTRQIASRVGVNHGLIPYYFGTKQKLWRAAVDYAFGGMQAEIDAVLDDSATLDPRERLARIIRAHVHFVARRPAFVRLMLEEGKRRGERMRWIVDRHVQPLYDSIAALIEVLPLQGGMAHDISPVHFFYMMAGATGLIFHQAEECRRVSGVDPFDPTIVETHARLVERMLLGPAPN
jgi:TetR/AcrR family transcriptional regulator